MVGKKVYTIAKHGHLGAVALLLAITLLTPVAAEAQGDPTAGDPRSNVNVVGMTPDPADFPDLRYRQQNEPACAIRPGDSACIICAYNDYRGVDPDSGSQLSGFGFGDSWQGVSESCDAGDTWRSRLAPGYPGDLDAENIPAEFAADPRLAAIPGMAIFNFIGGYRDSNVGVLAIQHWLEVNKEDSDHYEPGHTTWFADTGTSGRFLDKPDMLAVLDKVPGTITLQTVMENSELGDDGVITRDFPTGTLYVAFAAFTGSNSIKVLLKTSRDWGRTWKNQVLKLSEDQNQVSGITLTAIDNKVLAVWRRKGDGNDPDSILYSVITNGGKKATKGEVLADVCAFDQPTLTGSEIDADFNVVTFRTNDFPWTANDGENFYVFYSDRERVSPGGACLTDAQGNPNGKPRIVMHHSTLSGNADWTPYGPIDTSASLTPNTFQFMPTAFGANGKVQVAWYDTRRDPSDPLALPFIADYDALVEGKDPTFINGFLVNRTVDVFTTRVSINGSAVEIPPPVRASQFSILVAEDGAEYETEASFANKKLFAQGSASFLGDYIAMAAREYRRNVADTAWESNSSALPNRTEDFFVAWTDNRDVRGAITSLIGSSSYSYGRADSALQAEVSENETDAEQLVTDFGPPRDSSMIAEGIDGSDIAIGTCDAQTERTRDANIYGSLIKDRERLYAPNPTKPLGGLERAFPVVLRNSEDVAKSYRLEIACNGCQASFRQRSLLTPEYNEPPLTIIDETGEEISNPQPYFIVDPQSQIARTVFVTGDQPPVKVEAYDETNTLVATIQLANSLDEFRDPENCTSGNCSVATNELHNLELQTIDVHFLDLLTAGENELDALSSLNCTRDDSPEDCDPSIAASILIDWAVENGCCAGEDPPSLGSVIEFAVENLADETINIQDPDNTTADAALLNAALLNAALLNANLLNASLLNASLLNAALLNANLLNSSPTNLSGLDEELVNTAIDGGCCVPEIDPTVGSIIVWHVNNPEFINASLLNASLLNAALLNANLLNANLLNASLLNASLLNANLLNASLLNASLLNAALLNPTVEAAALLNANLLNADLLNASLLNPTLVEQAVDGGCCVDELGDPVTPTAVDVIVYAVGHPEIINASLLNASLLNANLLNANLLNANLLNANLLNANLLNANLLNADLLNANLLNANLLNANLLNADLLNANLLNASLLNSSLTDITYDSTGEPTVTVRVGNDEGLPQTFTGDVTFDDYTYPITNNGNVTTAIDADITINAPTVTVDGEEVLDVIGTKLIIWTTNATPTVVDCEERVQLNTRVQSITLPDTSFDVADINNPFKGQASAVVAAGQTAFVTLRVVGTKEQLKNVRVSGFTASSQAANCYAATGCDDALNEGVEQITFADQDPPVITVPGDIIVEANNTDGAVVDYTATVFDASDANPSLDCLPESGSVFPVGLTLVTCNATDASGNQADTVGFNVVVQDTTPPTITAPASATFEANGNPRSTVDIGTATVSDLFAVTVTSDAPTDGFSLGTTEVIWTATDANGLKATATQSVTIEDKTAPSITVPQDKILEANGDPNTTGTIGTATGSDLFAVTVSSDAPASFPLGDTTVTWTATDANGNEATATQTVTVQDTTSPSITAPADKTLEANGNPDSTGDIGTATGSDLFAVTITSDAPAGFLLGDTIVTWTATDANGNQATATQTVTVEDNTAPSITAPGPITEEANGNPNSSVDIGTAIAVDLFGAIISNDAPAQGFPLGTTTVVWTATDNNGLFATATQLVTVVDTTAPSISLVGANPQVIEAGAAYVELGATANDPVFGDITGAIVIDSTGVDTSTVGNYTVTYDVDDAQDNPADQVTRTVTVQDTTSPVIDPVTLPDDLNPNSPYPFELAANANTIEVSWPIGVDDADPNVVISCSIDGQALIEESRVEADGTVTVTYKYDFPVGSTTVTCTATDADNPSTEIQFTIDVEDVTPPLAPVTPTDDFSGVEATSSAGATVTWSQVSAQDAVDGSVDAICAPASESTFPLGTTTVSCTATDEAGLTSDASTFDITIVDTTAPTLLGTKLGTTVTVDAGADGTASPVLDEGISAQDLADPTPSVVCSPAPPLSFGETTITCTAVDAAGNSAAATYVINVRDVTDPTITLIGPASITLEAGVDGYTEQGATALDNVDGDISANITITGAVDTATVGEYQLLYDVSDNRGLPAVTEVRTVSVVDTIKPVITVPTSPLLITTASSPANVTYDVSVLDAGYPAPATTADCVPASGDEFTWGDTPVTCNATDASGNAADSATFTVRVRYLYDIEVIVGKTRVKLGSTIPFDWLYRDWDGNLVDSSHLQPDIGITWATTSNCINPDGTGPSGEDSGSSDFRYSAADGIWQYSLQTKDLIGGGQKYLVSIVPPGQGVESATTCVTLR